MAKFSFQRDFQIQIIGLLYQDFEFLLLGHDIIASEYFCDNVLAWFFETIRDYYLDYQMRIDEVSLKNEIKKAAKAGEIKKPDYEGFVKVFAQIQETVPNSKYIADEIVTFCKHQAIRKAAMEIPDLLNNNEFDAIAKVMGNALAVGDMNADLGIQYFSSFTQRIAYRAEMQERRIFPTGITPLDTYIGGGLKAGQLGIWMAPTNRGKSVALVHCGKRTVIYKQNVLFYTLELEEEEVAERYDASFTGVKVNDLVDYEDVVASGIDELGRKHGNSLLIKSFPTKTATVDTLRAHLKQCLSVGFVPDLICVDYLDLMKSHIPRREKREELTDITEGLKGLAGEMKIPIWTATQSRRAAVAKETHGEDDVAEDWGKMFTADIVITINQTQEEAGNNQIRLYIAKNRNGPRAVEVKGIDIDFARMVFYKPFKEDPNAGAANKKPGKAVPPKRRPGKKAPGKTT
jgi:replicative DNA helicase